jgi:hypothetical protein
MACSICGQAGKQCQPHITINDNIRKVCHYTLEFLEADKIVLIHERNWIGDERISLTNCIERVLHEIITGYNLCIKEWAFVEHSNNDHSKAKSVYHEYDYLEIGDTVEWKYLWHNDTKQDPVKDITHQLIIDRVNLYRKGAKTVI